MATNSQATRIDLIEPISSSDLITFTYSENLIGCPVYTTINSTPIKGVFTKRSGSNYTFVAKGSEYVINSEGKIISDVGKGTTVYLVNQELVGASEGVITRGASDKILVSSLNPRDEFAKVALKAMMEKLDNPEVASDSIIQLYCEASYRWAQAMVYSSAKARNIYKEETTTQDQVDVDTSSLNDNLDKILYNINESLKTLNKDNKTSANTTKTSIDTLSTNMNSMNTNISSIKTALQGTLKIDNPYNDKFEIEGGGGEGGWPSKDQLLNISTNDISGIVAFKNNAAGYAEKSSILDIAKSDGLWARSYTDGTTFILRNSSNISAAINQWTTTKIDDAINKLITDYGLAKP